MFYNVAQGTTNHLARLAAEHSVIAEYAGRAHHILAHRWRGAAGEIDLIFCRWQCIDLHRSEKEPQP